MSQLAKKCPRCGVVCALEAPVCGCGHQFRTRFTAAPAPEPTVMVSPPLAPRPVHPPLAPLPAPSQLPIAVERANPAAQPVVAFAAIVIFLLVFGLVMGRFYSPLRAPLFAAVQTVSDARSKLKLGMTQTQVRSVMGDPDRTGEMESGDYRITTWYYWLDGHQVQLVFGDIMHPENGDTLSAVNDY